MSMNLILKPSCGGCGSAGDLYGTSCKHLTLCVSCAKTMAENGATCYDCGSPITGLIREYNVRTSSNSDKNHFIGRFLSGLPNFSKKRSENKWFLQKEGLQGRQLTDTLREKYKNKPWLLEDEIGTQFHGQPEGAQSAIYSLLVMQGKEFVAIPAGSWYSFNKVAQYKQLTLEEAEEKMKNRRKTADGYQRWMMKAANNGAAAFGEVEKYDDKEVGSSSSSGKGKKKTGTDDEEGRASDHGEEDGEEEASRKSRLGLNKKNGGDDDEEGLRGGDLDMDDDDIEKGDDWEHEEIFTDDDEAVGNAEEREDLAPEIPAPPEIKQDDEDEDEGNEEEGGGLSKSGKELKKLLGRSNGLNDSDGDDDDDDDEDSDDDVSAVAASTKQKEGVKEETTENTTPSKSNTTSGSTRATVNTNTTASKSSKGKRKLNGDESKSSSNDAPQKKIKSENDSKPGKEENTTTTTNGVSTKNNKNVSPLSSTKAHGKNVSPQSSTKTGPVTEDEIRAMLPPKTQVTTQDLVAKFKSRLKSKEDKDAFAEILKKISKIQTVNGKKIIVLREK